MINKITPFVKWAGGKRQLKNEIKQRMPKKFNSYFEPFVGGGALLMELQNEKNTISDVNSQLIGTYKSVRDNPDELMNLLDMHENNHKINPKEYYYKIRSLDQHDSWKKTDTIEKSAIFIYLNKTCFNGLYRLNSSGYFNVPFNNKLTIKLYERSNIICLSRFLNQKVNIFEEDFETVSQKAKPGDFIFFDPPYDLLNKTTFDKYNKDRFGVKGQKRLAKVAHKLREKGCYVMITNHNTELINDLYKDFKRDVVVARRNINSNSKKRMGIETIIYGY